MAEYLIFFNDDRVTETTNEGWQKRARDAGAVIEDMKTAGVPTPEADRAAAGSREA